MFGTDPGEDSTTAVRRTEALIRATVPGVGEVLTYRETDDDGGPIIVLEATAPGGAAEIAGAFQTFTKRWARAMTPDERHRICVLFSAQGTAR